MTATATPVTLPLEFARLARSFWPRVIRSEIGRRCWYLEVKSRGHAPIYSASNRPRVSIGTVNVPAVKIAWELTGRGDTSGMAMKNRCGDEGCINPEHYYTQDYSSGSRGTGLADIIKTEMPATYSRGTIPTDADRKDAALLALLSEPGITLQRALVTPWQTYIGTDPRELALQAERERPG